MSHSGAGDRVLLGVTKCFSPFDNTRVSVLSREREKIFMALFVFVFKQNRRTDRKNRTT